MDLSVVLCTWNNAARLRVTLDAIAQCEVPEGLRWEVVLVNNNCTDTTDAVADEYVGRLPLQYVHEPTPGLSHARNAGLGAASGEWVLFTDDDVKPCRQWITTYWQAIQDKPGGYLFGGPIESDYEVSPPVPELLRFAPSSVSGLNWGSEPRELTADEWFVSANWACRREDLIRVGSFDPSLGINASSSTVLVGEETELMERLQADGLRTWYLPGASLRHFVPADKVDLDHIAARYEAGAFTSTRRRIAGGTSRMEALRRMLSLSRKGLGEWSRWTVGRLQGSNDYRNYMRWRRTRGRMRAYLDYLRGR